MSPAQFRMCFCVLFIRVSSPSTVTFVMNSSLSDCSVSDEALIQEVNKVSSEESERQRRLGYSSRQKVTHSHSAQLETDKDTGKPPDSKTKNKNKEIEELSSKVDALTKMVEALLATKTAEQPCQSVHTQPRHKQTAKRYECPKCIEKGTDSCNHCFICGNEGHKASGCLKRWEAKNSSQSSADVHALSNSEWQCTTKIELQMENQTDVQTVSPVHSRTKSLKRR